jgi:hypothetical protein
LTTITSTKAEALRRRLRPADISLRYEPVVRIDKHGNFFDAGRADHRFSPTPTTISSM